MRFSLRGRRPPLALLLSIGLALGARASFADTVMWADAVDGDWSDDAAWTPHAPEPGDDVVIDVAGTYTVLLDVDAAVGSLALGGASGVQTLRSDSHILTLASASTVAENGVLLLSGGTLTGAGSLTVDGTFDWTAGTVSGPGAFEANGPLIMESGSAKTLAERTLVSNATAELRSLGIVTFSTGAVIRNAASGTFELEGNTIMQTGGTPSGQTFENLGTLTKTGAGNALLDVLVDSSGTVNADAGVLVAQGGGTWSGLIASDAVLRFDGGVHDLSGVTITGSGRVEIDGGGMNSAGEVTVESPATLALRATGVIGGTAAMTVNGTFEWTGGTVLGNGPFTVNGPFVIDSGLTKDLSRRTLVSNGMAQWRSTGLVFVSSGGVLRNSSTGRFEVQSNAPMQSAGVPRGTFDNDGVLVKTAAGGTTTFGVDFTNSGTVEIQSGTAAFTQAPYVQTAGATVLNGGNLSATVGVDIQGGRLGGSGTVTANVSNAGSLAPGLSPGRITIDGNYEQTATGSFDVEIGGLAAQTHFDQLDVNGTAALDGALNVVLINGFTPAAGNQFLVLDGTTTGDFSDVNLPPLPSGLGWEVTVGSVLLTVVEGVATFTPTTTPETPVATPTPTPTTTPTIAVSPTPTGTATDTPATPVTQTPTPTPTATSITSTATRTITGTIPEPTETPTASPTETAPPGATATDTATATPTAETSATTTPEVTATTTESPVESPTETPTGTPAPTASETPPATETSTAATETPTPTATPTETRTPVGTLCTGDCNENGEVSINELVLAVDLALRELSAESCPAADENGDDAVAVNELIAAVRNALDGCP